MSSVQNMNYGNIIERKRGKLCRSTKRVADDMGMDVEEYRRKEKGFEPFTDKEKELLKKVLV